MVAQGLQHESAERLAAREHLEKELLIVQEKNEQLRATAGRWLSCLLLDVKLFLLVFVVLLMQRIMRPWWRRLVRALSRRVNWWLRSHILERRGEADCRSGAGAQGG